MFVIGHLLRAIAVVLEMGLNIYMLIIIAHAILSWVNPDPYNPIVRFIHNVTDPVLDRIRKTIPVVFGGIDFSPILVLVALAFLKSFVVGTLYSLAITFLT